MNITYFLKIRGQQKARLPECFIDCPFHIFHDLFFQLGWISTFNQPDKSIYSQSSIPSNMVLLLLDGEREQALELKNCINGGILCNRGYIKCTSFDQN